MTTFEITIIVLLAAIVVLLTWHCTLTRNNYCLNQTKELKRQQDFERLTDTVDKMVDMAYPPTYVTPCYAPNGICTNPQMDCINCPKRSTGGTWSTNTSIKAEDAPLQERFNDNKED